MFYAIISHDKANSLDNRLAHWLSPSLNHYKLLNNGQLKIPILKLMFMNQLLLNHLKKYYPEFNNPKETDNE